MYQDKTVKNFIASFQKYRRMQKRLEKLRTGKPHPNNINKVKPLLASIQGTLTDMDIMAAQLELSAKRAGKILVDVKKLVN